ncbi:hypothetical protein AJ80_03258 [Polytolypa hystricis UAMH7299]|uniref:Lytic polysaccharide monooxygenase n=1 Tax=Polytolypa hystricis (strain UAMH7299) TaxID=1447883 RepID=A0A2B7YLH5_POLH7|nr:hypothetical protein AJ80_03258 [Polytolypa hystricis UAMH7299]
MSLFKYLSLLALTSPLVQGHMQLFYPPPFQAENNPHRKTPADTQLNYPYNCCGKTTPFPCRGYLKLLGTPEGASVATWAAGSDQKFSLIGGNNLGGTHYGGSCQVGFSIDQGKTWKAVRSYEGNCPNRRGTTTDPKTQEFEFKVPGDMPTGDAVFAWTWINREQEFFMLCSAVTITGGEEGESSSPENPPPPPIGGSESAPPPPPAATKATTAPPSSTKKPDMIDETPVPIPQEPADYIDGNGCMCTCPRQQLLVRKPRAAAPGSSHSRHASRQHAHHPKAIAARAAERVAFTDRPDMFIANTGNGCKTPATAFELKYPNPGYDLVKGDGEYKLKLPEPAGKCGY